MRNSVLLDLPRQFAGIRSSPYMVRFLTTALRLCPRGSHSLEVGATSPLGAIWLSQRGVCAEGIDPDPLVIEQAKHATSVLSGSARFRVCDPFHLIDDPVIRQAAGRYSLIHHQGLLEHFPFPWIRALLAQQVVLADWVAFTVPSVYYPFTPEHGDERLLPLEEWQRILEPFDVADLTYFGDPQHGEREHVLAVLNGQHETAALKRMMGVGEEPYPEGISAIVHTRNESRNIAACLETLSSWIDEIIVCDMESDDDTVEIARRFTDQIVQHPRISNFDQARNVSAMRARYRWIFYIDADERVPPALGPVIREMVETRGDEFQALLTPFKHHFAGKWLTFLYPGYTSARVFKNGRFVFNARLHAGAQVNGVTSMVAAEDPNLALVHYSYDSMAHYLEKINRYTDAEAENMHRDRAPFHWQQSLAHFTRDLRSYYDDGRSGRDGPHGFIYAFFSGFYRFAQHAKLFERRFNDGALQQPELAVPGSAEEMLEYMLSVLRERPAPAAPAIRVSNGNGNGTEGCRVVWSGPLADPSGYGEESRNFLAALDAAGVPAAAHVIPWSHDRAPLTETEERWLTECSARAAVPGFVHITQNFANTFARHPKAGVSIGRTMFETDRLPEDWVRGCNRMDYVWVPSAFNRQSFAEAGVSDAKLVVMPGCFLPGLYASPPDADAVQSSGVRELLTECRFVFLAAFDWTRHKGWDTLLRGFLSAFEGRDDVLLVLKAWSTMGYSNEDVCSQAAGFARDALGGTWRKIAVFDSFSSDCRPRTCGRSTTPAAATSCQAAAKAGAGRIWRRWPVASL